LSLFYKLCIKISEIDIFKGPNLYDRLFSFKETPPYSMVFLQYEFGDMNFFMNTGSLLIFVFIAIAAALLFNVLHWLAT